MEKNGDNVLLLLVSVTFLFLNVPPVLAQGFKNPPEGSSAISQAGAFIAQCDDASAVTHNPAGLVQIEGQQILFGNTFLYPTTLYKNGGVSEDAVSNMAYLPFIYYATDLGTEKLRFGMGISSPYGQATEWSKDIVRTNWFYSEPYYSSMQTINFSPVLAYKFTPRFSAGAGLNVYYSRLGIEYLVPPGAFLQPDETTSEIDVNGTGYGGTLGLLYKGTNYSIGLTYKKGFTVDYDGDFEVTGILKEDAEVEIEFPHIAVIGFAFYPNPNLKFEFDAEWAGYSCLEEIPVTIENLPPSPPIEKNWEDCYMFSLGTEYKKSENVKLMGGIAYLTSSMPDSTWKPSLPGSDSIVVVAGSEFSGRLGTLNLSLGLNLFKERKIDEGGLYDGKYSSTGYFCTLGYKKSF